LLISTVFYKYRSFFFELKKVLITSHNHYQHHRIMNNFLSKLFFLALLSGIAFGTYSMYKAMLSPRAVSPKIINPINSVIKTPPNLPAHNGELIQIALLLDVSGSMEGLINQARAELWKVVNDLSGRNEANSRLEIALYAYGYGGQPIIRRLSDFTSDLDRVSQLLYSLNTSGSQEWCGSVIRDAVVNLSWRQGSSGGRFMCIAGNEPFTQGPFSYEQACNMASAKGIVVNTIFCGEEHVGLERWRRGRRRSIFCHQSQSPDTGYSLTVG
jgi:hypothetical protein